MTGKFRAYDKVEKCYDEDSRFVITKGGRLIELYAGNEEDVTDRYEIEWETGLHDHLAEMIHLDSDIIRYRYQCNGEDGEFWDEAVGVVVLDKRATLSLCVRTKGGGLYHFTASELRNIEIIGTIHDEGGE